MTHLNRLVALWVLVTALAISGIYLVKVLLAHVQAPWARGAQDLVGAV